MKGLANLEPDTDCSLLNFVEVETPLIQVNL